MHPPSPPPQLPLCSKLYHLHLHHHDPNSNNVPKLDSVVAFASLLGSEIVGIGHSLLMLVLLALSESCCCSHVVAVVIIAAVVVVVAVG